MAFDINAAYSASDADDEYERDPHDAGSPTADEAIASDEDETSMGEETEEEEISSSEHTPTRIGAHDGANDARDGSRDGAERERDDRLERRPTGSILAWTQDDCADFVGSLGLRQYADEFLDNEIVGEALVALQHEDLKEMGISSVGHRLTILKGVYDIKVKQAVEMGPDHYIPPSAELEAGTASATINDFQSLVDQLAIRDERIAIAEKEMRRITDEYRRLREELLPVFRRIKESEQPLPLPAGSAPQSYSHSFGFDGSALSPPSQPATTNGSNLARNFSTKKLFLSSAPKGGSPTYLQTTQEHQQPFDPVAERSVLTSSHLAAISGSPSPGHSSHVPSPTSPPTVSSFPGNATASGRSTFLSEAEQYGGYQRETAKEAAGAIRRKNAPPQLADTSAAPASSNASISGGEIYKSFKVSMEDPCYKVLPAALKKYNINAPPEDYALYIVCGKEERCLQHDEKPLILFKQLDKEGKKPMFMLRRLGHSGALGLGGAAANIPATDVVPGSAGLDRRFNRARYDGNVL